MLDSRQTLRIIPVPLVLVVSGTRTLVEQCREVIEPYGVLLRQCDVIGLRTAAARWRPLAVLLTEDLYAFDPEGFEMLAGDVGSTLVVARGPADAATALRRLVGTFGVPLKGEEED
jgi:hypothetical protein